MADSESGAVNFKETVVPITGFKLGIRPSVGIDPLSKIGLEARFGTGFCLDVPCRYIVTNYHVAAIQHPAKVQHERVVRQDAATGPDDQDSTVNDVYGGDSLRFNLSRDLVILELERPLRKHRGLPFSMEELEPGQEVDIYSFPYYDGINPMNAFRKLKAFHATFEGETTTHLLAFRYSYSSNRPLRGGASGGIVVDTKTRQIVGILNAVAKHEDGVALAVSVPSLVDFVRKTQPFLAHDLFPAIEQVSPVATDLYLPLQPVPASATLQHRPEEPNSVWLLRQKAQALADSMKNYSARQTFEWGIGNYQAKAFADYEIRVVDDRQHFRLLPNGRKEYLDHPPVLPWSYSFVPGSEWSELPRLIGYELKLRIRQAPDAVVDGRRVLVFQYRGSVEDDICGWDITDGFALFTTHKSYNVACHGEVWTDENENVLRISEEYEDKEPYKALVTYAWIKQADQISRLLPSTIVAAHGHGNRIYWCRGEFEDYRLFTSEIKIVASTPMPVKMP